MKRIQLIAFTLAGVLMILSACNGGGQIENPKDNVIESVPGGYSACDVNDADVLSAAMAGVELVQAQAGYEIATLVRIESAQRQIVAGQNFKLIVVLNTAQGEKRMEMIVYKPLGEKALELSSINEL